MLHLFGTFLQPFLFNQHEYAQKIRTFCAVSSTLDRVGSDSHLLSKSAAGTAASRLAFT